MTERQGLGAALADVVAHGRALLQLELDLAKQEARAALDAARRSLLWAGAGVALGALALQALAGAAVLGLATAWPAWLAAGAVGLVLAAAGALALRVAAREAGGDALRPKGTVETIKETGRWLASRT